MRNALISLATLVVLLTLPAGPAAAAPRRTSDAVVTVEGRRAPAVETDARHAALVVRAGVRFHVVEAKILGMVQPNIAPDLGEAVPARRSTGTRGLDWIDAGIGAGAAIVILCGGAVLVVRRRKPLAA